MPSSWITIHILSQSYRKAFARNWKLTAADHVPLKQSSFAYTPRVGEGAACGTTSELACLRILMSSCVAQVRPDTATRVQQGSDRLQLQ